MSTLNVANISDDQSTLTGSSQNPIDKLHSNATVDTKFVTNGCAKAYATPSSTGTLDWDTFNVTTATDSGQGDIGVNFNTAMSSANYSVTMTVVTTTDKNATLGNPSTATFYIRVFDKAGSPANARTSAQVLGDLA